MSDVDKLRRKKEKKLRREKKEVLFWVLARHESLHETFFIIYANKTRTTHPILSREITRVSCSLNSVPVDHLVKAQVNFLLKMGGISRYSKEVE